MNWLDIILLAILALGGYYALTELLSYEDLGFCEKGSAKEHIADGVFELGSPGFTPATASSGLISLPATAFRQSMARLLAGGVGCRNFSTSSGRRSRCKGQKALVRR